MALPILSLVLSATVATSSSACTVSTCASYQRASYNYRAAASLGRNRLDKCLARETELSQQLENKDVRPIISDWAIGVAAIAIVIGTGAVIYLEVK